MINFALGIILLVAPEVLNTTYVGWWMVISSVLVMAICSLVKGK